MKTISIIILFTGALAFNLVASNIFYREDFSNMTANEPLPLKSGTLRSHMDFSGKEDLALKVVEYNDNPMLLLSDTGSSWVGARSTKIKESTNAPVRTFSFKFLEKEDAPKGHFHISFGTWLGPKTTIASWKFLQGNIFGKPRYELGAVNAADIVINNSAESVTAGEVTLPPHTHTLFINGQPVGRPQELTPVEGLESGKPIEQFFFRSFSSEQLTIMIDDIEFRTGTYVSGMPDQDDGEASYN